MASSLDEEKKEQKKSVYNLDEEWMVDIDNYNPESFVSEYPKLKKLLQTLDIDPIEYTSKIILMLNKYQEKPELLDVHLEEICNILMSKYIKINLNCDNSNENNLLNCGFKIIYTLSIIRGYKTIVVYLPHEVSDLEPTLLYLLSIDQNKLSLWYTRYVLCIWLSIIIRIPFNLNTIDSFGDIINKIVFIVKLYLEKSEKSREGAAILISRLFSRTDLQETYMGEFINWCIDKLSKSKEEENIFLFTGIFRSLAEIFKHAHRNEYLKIYAKLILNNINIKSKSRIVRKYKTKLIQRIGLVFLKPIIANWRYEKPRQQMGIGVVKTDNIDKKTEDNDEDIIIPTEIEYILDILLNLLRDRETVVRWSSAKGIGRITMRLPLSLGDEIITSVLELLSPTETHESWHGGCLCLAELSRRGLLLPSRISNVINRICKAMLYDIYTGQSSIGDQVRDSACYVAWAFARAYDPKIMQPYVLKLSKSLLTMAVFDKEIHCRRAACAAFQENVGRQGNFPHGIEINTTADYWTVGLLKNSYLNVSKTIAKFNEYKYHLIDHLVNIKLTYWDLKIRNIAANALYELTPFDINYIVNNILPILINRCQSQSVFERHGALCAISYIIKKLNELKKSNELNEQLIKHIKNIIPKLEKNRGYRGRGGDKIRMESCNLINQFLNANFILSNKLLDRYQQTIDENLKIPQDFVQNAATNALKQLSKNYYNKCNDIELNNERCKNITIKWCNILQKEIIASITRGYCRGLGVLSKKLILPHLKLVIDTLIMKTLITENEDTRDYQTRKYACIALADLIENIGINKQYKYDWNVNEDIDIKHNDNDDEANDLGINLDITKEKHEKNKYNSINIRNEKFKFIFDIKDKNEIGATSLLYDRIIGTLLLRFEDYEVDRRGDVGSFVREHNLFQIYRCMILLAKHNCLRESLPTLILNMILRQLSEKLDRVRRAAGKIIELIFDSNDLYIQSIRFDEDAQIRSIFSGHSINKLDWSNPSLVFPLLVKTLDLQSYRTCIIEGLLQSIGCINSSMSKLALNSLEPYLNKLNIKANQNNDYAIKQLINISNDFIYCIKKRYLNQLFIIPFLKAIGILLSDKIYFEPLQNNKKYGYKFSINMYNQLKKECYKSTDIFKLLTSIKVFIGLILFENTRELSLQRLMIFMGYQYPALRKQTCQELSSAIATFGDKIIKHENEQNIAFDYLSTNIWGGNDLDKIRLQRNKLFEMFDIQPPKLKKKK